jgi:hypothetical protein
MPVSALEISLFSRFDRSLSTGSLLIEEFIDPLIRLTVLFASLEANVLFHPNKSGSMTHVE